MELKKAIGETMMKSCYTNKWNNFYRWWVSQFSGAEFSSNFSQKLFLVIIRITNVNVGLLK